MSGIFGNASAISVTNLDLTDLTYMIRIRTLTGERKMGGGGKGESRGGDDGREIIGGGIWVRPAKLAPSSW